jgi:hypothetical protein
MRGGSHFQFAQGLEPLQPTLRERPAVSRWAVGRALFNSSTSIFQRRPPQAALGVFIRRVRDRLQAHPGRRPSIVSVNLQGASSVSVDSP